MDERKLLDIVGELYDASTEPARLGSVGMIVQRAMRTESSIHFVSEKKSGRMLKLLAASDNFDVDARRDYAGYYHDRNVWFGEALHHEPPYVARGEELVDYTAFDRTEFCADWCSRVGIYHMIGCIFPIMPAVVGGSGIHRTRRQGPFTDDEKRLYGVVMSHLSRALQIADRTSARPDG